MSSTGNLGIIESLLSQVLSTSSEVPAPRAYKGEKP